MEVERLKVERLKVERRTSNVERCTLKVGKSSVISGKMDSRKTRIEVYNAEIEILKKLKVGDKSVTVNRTNLLN